MPKKHAKKAQSEPAFDIRELYDMLMYEIEPELMTDMIEESAKMFQNESEDDRRARAKRYAVAFEVFSERFGKLITLWKDHLNEFKDSVIEKLREESGIEESGKLSDIEQSISDM